MNRPVIRLSERSATSKLRLSTLLATTVTAATLVLSSSASLAQSGDDSNSWTEFGLPAFETEFPIPEGSIATSDAEDGLLLDLPTTYFAQVSFPPMSDFGVEEPPILLAGLDSLATP
jgi:hypothetical protein